MNGEFWKKHICSRISLIREISKKVWKNEFNDTEREKEYVQMKECPKNEFCRWKCGGRSETDGERRMFDNERE